MKTVAIKLFLAAVMMPKVMGQTRRQPTFTPAGRMNGKLLQWLRARKTVFRLN